MPPFISVSSFSAATLPTLGPGWAREVMDGEPILHRWLLSKLTTLMSWGTEIPHLLSSGRSWQAISSL